MLPFDPIIYNIITVMQPVIKLFRDGHDSENSLIRSIPAYRSFVFNETSKVDRQNSNLSVSRDHSLSFVPPLVSRPAAVSLVRCHNGGSPTNGVERLANFSFRKIFKQNQTKKSNRKKGGKKTQAKEP